MKKIDTLRKRIRMLLAQKDMTQKQLSEAIGVSRKNFNLALRKRNTPRPVEYLQRAVAYLESL